MVATASTGPVQRPGAGAARHPGLAAPELLDALRAAASVLEQHAEGLDQLGVAPAWSSVGADGVGPGAPGQGGAPGRDGAMASGATPARPGPGTDLAATLGAACEAVGDDGDLSSVCRGLVSGSRGAARTTTGRRLSEFLAGMADALRNSDRVDGSRLALSLEAGAERVTEADDGTHPGCLVSVMSAAADGALGASDDGGDLLEVLVSAAEAGLVELELGPTTDPKLAERGAVDPGAAGFLLVLDSLAAVVSGEPLPEPPRRAGEAVRIEDRPGTRFVVRCVVTPAVPDIEVAADIEVLVHELSDDLRFDGTGARWTVEAVTTLPGAVIEALAGSGALSEMHVGLAEPSA